MYVKLDKNNEILELYRNIRRHPSKSSEVQVLKVGGTDWEVLKTGLSPKEGIEVVGSYKQYKGVLPENFDLSSGKYILLEGTIKQLPQPGNEAVQVQVHDLSMEPKIDPPLVEGALVTENGTLLADPPDNGNETPSDTGNTEGNEDNKETFDSFGFHGGKKGRKKKSNTEQDGND